MIELKGLSFLSDFYVFSKNDRYYLFLVSQDKIITYELDHDKPINKNEYGPDYFSLKKMFISEILPIEGNELLLLDFHEGIIKIKHK